MNAFPLPAPAAPLNEAARLRENVRAIRVQHSRKMAVQMKDENGEIIREFKPGDFAQVHQWLRENPKATAWICAAPCPGFAWIRPAPCPDFIPWSEPVHAVPLPVVGAATQLKQATSTADTAADDAEDDARSSGNDKERKEEANSELTKPGIIVVCAADIEPEPIDWLWPDRFAFGKISMIAGQGALGKSSITIDMAARITTGREWPNGEGVAPTGNVIFLSAEDDPKNVLIPRLMAAGAERRRAHIIPAVKDKPEQGSRIRHFNVARDVAELCKTIDEIGNVRMIVIDPITSYLGSGKDVDSHKATEVRDALNPLVHYTEKLNIATILINHLNKSGGTDAMNRVLGSGAFVQLARTVYLVVPDSEKERALFLSAKNNLSKKAPGLAYKPITKFVSTPKHPSIETSAIEWSDDEIDKTADEALADIGARVVVGGGEHTSVGEAMNFLRDVLTEGPMAAKAVEQQAKEAGIASRTLRRAKEKIGVTARHRGDGGTGGRGEWVWEMPEQIVLRRTDIAD